MDYGFTNICDFVSRFGVFSKCVAKCDVTFDIITNLLGILTVLY